MGYSTLQADTEALPNDAVTGVVDQRDLRRSPGRGLRLLAYAALLFPTAPAIASGLNDAAAIAVAKPQMLIVDRSLSPAKLAALLRPVNAFYGFWNNGNQALLDQAVSPSFTDHELPLGRPQGPRGPMVGLKGFLGAVPNLRITVMQRIIAGDRVTSLLHCTGHFTGAYAGVQGAGQTVDFISVDILRVQGGRITDNWHLEDNLTFLKQIGVVK